MKQKLLPELAEIRAELAGCRERELRMQSDLTVIVGRLDQMDKRFEQVDKRFEQVDKRFEQMDKRFEQMETAMRELKDDLREVRSYVFTTTVTGKASPYGVVREKRGR